MRLEVHHWRRHWSHWDEGSGQRACDSMSRTVCVCGCVLSFCFFRQATRSIDRSNASYGARDQTVPPIGIDRIVLGRECSAEGARATVSPGCRRLPREVRSFVFGKVRRRDRDLRSNWRDSFTMLRYDYTTLARALRSIYQIEHQPRGPMDRGRIYGMDAIFPLDRSATVPSQWSPFVFSASWTTNDGCLCVSGVFIFISLAIMRHYHTHRPSFAGISCSL